MKRIVFIIGSMYRGGTERVVSILANDYIAKSWNVDIIMLLHGMVDYELDVRIKLIDYSGKAKTRIGRIPMWIYRLRSYMRKENPAIIFAFAHKINVVTLAAAWGLHKTIFVSERIDPRYDNRSKLGDYLSRKMYMNARTVIFQTRRQQGYFGDLKNGVIIPNPISVPVSASEVKTKKIVTVGRLAPQKNQKLLIDSFIGLTEDYPEYRLEIYGDGIFKDELRAYISEKKMEERIFLRGNVSNVHERISDAELFVLSSDYEGLSNALMEAMMMGIPVISTNVSGADEYIEDGVNGLLVPVGDERALTAAIRRMLSNSELREHCGKNAKKITDIVSKEVVLERWHKVLETEE